MQQSLSIVLLGKNGAGKSASGNTILGRQAFKSNKSIKSVTQDVVEGSGMVDGQHVTIYDTPGFCDPEMRENEIQQMINKKVLQKCESGVCVFLLVIKADIFTADERKTVERIEKVLGEKRLNQTWILITGGDKLKKENKTIKEFLDENESLKKLIQKNSQRYHVFDNDNQRPGSSDQVKMLLTKIIQQSLGLKPSDGGRLLRQIPNIRANIDDEQQKAGGGLSCIRIVLLGKTGVGKSATGNTILGQDNFISKMRQISVTSKCSENHSIVSDRQVSVVDTPGFFDTNMQHKEFMTELARTVYLSSPGPHTFLIVFRVIDRFTEQEMQIYDEIEVMFGEEVSKYAIILFTRGDELEGESIETLIEENCPLRHLVQECGGRYHVFDNKQKNNTKQVTDLLHKINTMIEQNGGGHYSNEMFYDAQKFREEEQKRKQSEEEEIKAKTSELEAIKANMKREKEERKQKEKQLQEEAERAIKEIKKREQELKTKKEEVEKMLKMLLQGQHNDGFAQFHKKYEKRFHFSASALGKLSLGSFVTACGCLGAVVGVIGGPIGVAVGASVGVGIGVACAAVLDNVLSP